MNRAFIGFVTLPVTLRLIPPPPTCPDGVFGYYTPRTIASSTDDLGKSIRKGCAIATCPASPPMPSEVGE